MDIETCDFCGCESKMGIAWVADIFSGQEDGITHYSEVCSDCETSQRTMLALEQIARLMTRKSYSKDER